MTIIRKIISSFCLVAVGLALMSANRHLHTSVNQATNMLNVRVLDKTLKIKLDGPGVVLTKYDDGHLKHLSFFQVDVLYDIYFFPEERLGAEQVSLIQRYSVLSGQLLLDGPTYSFDNEGHLLTESNWKEGKHHGKQRILNALGQVIEDKEFHNGYPVGMWSLYYVDGTLASTVEFPEEGAHWKQTKSTVVVRTGVDFKRALDTLSLHKSLSAVEVWYTPQGVKHKEKHYKIFSTDDQVFVVATGRATVYNSEGQAIQEIDLADGTGTVRYLFDTYQVTATHLNDHVIRMTPESYPK